MKRPLVESDGNNNNPASVRPVNQMIFDTFSFFNELDLLELRLQTLSPVVDRFVLVEATRTHSGKPKPLVFSANKDRFSTFLSRIEHVVVDDFPPFETAWTYENFQRNCAMRGLATAKPDDWVLTSDLDEIPEPSKVLACSRQPGRYRFEQATYAYWMNVRNLRASRWHGTRMLQVNDFLHGLDDVAFAETPFVLSSVNVGTTATKWRFVENIGWKNVRNGGWHFTSLGGAKAIAEKADSFAHTELDTKDNRDVVSISARLAKGIGPFNRPPLAISSKATSLPPYVVEHPELYDQYFLQASFPLRLRFLARAICNRWGSTILKCIRSILPRRIRSFIQRLREKARSVGQFE